MDNLENHTNNSSNEDNQKNMNSFREDTKSDSNLFKSLKKMFRWQTVFAYAFCLWFVIYVFVLAIISDFSFTNLNSDAQLPAFSVCSTIGSILGIIYLVFSIFLFKKVGLYLENKSFRNHSFKNKCIEIFILFSPIWLFILFFILTFLFAFNSLSTLLIFLICWLLYLIGLASQNILTGIIYSLLSKKK